MTESKKFRRILVVAQNAVPEEWQELLERFAEDVVLVACDNFGGVDYLHQLFADCMISDSRVPDHDLISIGYLEGLAMRRGLPRLIFFDQRPGFDSIDGMRKFGASCVLREDITQLSEIERFLNQTEPAVMANYPSWQTRPWTCSIEELRQSGFRLSISTI